MSHTITAVIEKLRIWSAGEWKAYNTIQSKEANTYLRIHHDQLFILTKNKVLESLNLNGKMKGVFKDDVLILIICNAPQQFRKIKFRIMTNPTECFRKLSLHFPVASYNMSNLEHIRYKSIEEVLRTAINKKASSTEQILPPMPPNLNDFVKLCLLDPNFPNVVDEVQDILHNKI